MPRIIMNRAFIARWTRMPHSTGRLSASASSHHSLSSAAFITNIAESDFRHAQVTPTDDPLTSPGAVHPLVCTHPDTGRRMLYLGRRRNAYLVGLDLADSEALLDELWGFVDRPEFIWEHVWRVGDLVLWDNRCTMHRRDAFDPHGRRIMHRTQVKGEQRPR